MISKQFFCFFLSVILVIRISTALAEPVKIAGILSESGIATTNNLPFIQILKLGVEEINLNGGLLGNPLELLIIDNQSTPIGSKIAAEKAISLGVTAVIGAAWSSHSLQIAPILQSSKTPMITGSSTNPKVTLFGNFIFRVCFVDSFQAKVMAQFARLNLKAKTAVVLENINEEFSLTLSSLFVESFIGDGGMISAKESYYNKAVDFSDVLKKVIPLKPDVVYIPGYGRDSGLLIKQALSMGMRTTFLGADGWGGNRIYEFGGQALEGSYQSAHWHHEVGFTNSKYLQKKYKEKYNRKIPHTNAPLFYDAVMLFADAVRRAGTTNRNAIRDALAETKDFQGATGMITFDVNGDPLDKPVVILKLGRFGPIYYNTIQP